MNATSPPIVPARRIAASIPDALRVREVVPAAPVVRGRKSPVSPQRAQRIVKGR